jgi:hypothetical protein
MVRRKLPGDLKFSGSSREVATSGRLGHALSILGLSRIYRTNLSSAVMELGSL